MKQCDHRLQGSDPDLQQRRKASYGMFDINKATTLTPLNRTLFSP